MGASTAILAASKLQSFINGMILDSPYYSFK